jgi:iron-sulfur cluster assembly protein
MLDAHDRHALTTRPELDFRAGRPDVGRRVYVLLKGGRTPLPILVARNTPYRESAMAVSLAPAALDRVRRYLADAPDALGLRFGVKKTGCSGWQYVADLTKEKGANDRIFLQDDVRIYVDEASLPVVDGTQIDLVREKLGEQFVFRNPNVRAECGCGESFTTVDQD